MTPKTVSPDRLKRPTECVDEAPEESSAGVSVDKVTLCGTSGCSQRVDTFIKFEFFRQINGQEYGLTEG